MPHASCRIRRAVKGAKKQTNFVSSAPQHIAAMSTIDNQDFDDVFCASKLTSIH
jgi:hypothetical protein